uniref:RIMS-binding protein 2 n=1 Tax=Myripristis murdjan TaxID=586833 RepID=A0A667ZKL3_9TELE
HQNSELLRALEELEKTCSTLREENGLLRKSSAPETEEKVRRLRRKNTELAVLAKRLEERARKLQEANLKVVNTPSLLRPGSVEQYKRAFARQRARDLAQHADTLLSKDKEIAALQQECRELEARLGTAKGSPVPSGRLEFERLLRESQREVLRLQRQLSVTSSREQHNHSQGNGGPEEYAVYLLLVQESELCKKRKECENLEHEVKKRQKRCLDLESQLEDERGKNEQLKEEAELLRRKAQLLDQTRAENEELREDLSEVTAQHSSVLEENQRLRAKLENLEQVLKHMREVAERRQQLELEHEQALAILKFKQDEIKRLQRAQFFAKREHEGVVQMLEVSLCSSKVRDLEEKCRSQSEQFGLLSQELEKFRLQASKVDLAGSTLLTNPNLSVLTNGVGLTTDRGKTHTTNSCVDTASEVEELDIDVAPAPYTASRGAAKLQVFIARYSYNPYDGPNDNPEVELPLTAGEYIYVYGDMDDDGFYEGELMDGRRGLVPSNFVERVSDDDVMSTHHPETGDMSHNSLLDSTSAEVGVDTVPYPRKLTLIKQLAKSIIIGWDPPLVPAGWGNVWSYNVYVDQELRLNVPFGSQTKAVLERLDINLKAYRVSVQSLTEKGLSDQLRCSMLVGRDVCVAPTQLRVDRITATSANLSWLASNSNYVHIVSLNEEECELVKAGCYSLCLNNLLPSLQYTVKVEARPHRTPWELPVERREHKSTNITFTTLMAGPPDAPLDVQLEHGPSPGIALISWLPVTIDAAGISNGVRVTGYTIYADKKKVLEVSSPTAGSALLGPSQIQSLQTAQELTVRTMSAHGESCDSLPVNVPSKLGAIMAGPAATVPVVPAVPCTPINPNILPSSPSYGNSAAKVSMLPHTLPSDPHAIGLTVETSANPTHTLHSEALLSSASYVEAWANPSSAAALAPPSDFADNSRSDLSDILEEEEEDLYSDHLVEAQPREPPDSDEEVLERILKLPPQAGHSKQLFSIPEATEEEDNSQEESLPHHRQPRHGPSHSLSRNSHLRGSEHHHHNPQHHPHHPNPHPHSHPHHHHHHHHHHISRDPRAAAKEPLPRRGDDASLYEGPNSKRVLSRGNPQASTSSRERGLALIGGLGDRLRREAMLRSQMAATAAANTSHGLPPPGPYLVSKTVRTVRSPTGQGVEIDVEYGTDNEEPVDFGPGDVVVEQMSSEWWLEGAQMDHSRPPLRRGPKADQQQWVCCLSPPSTPVYQRNNDIRLFVALFPYDPATMSPNPDAAEEELPFSEGQIIKVYGDKDADGFYRGESGNQLGYVPCNMVSEIQVEDEETRQQLLQQGFLSTQCNTTATARGNPAPGARRMMAIFDYDPRESSPNTDIEAELTFSAGDIINVFGDMDDDGFFYVSSSKIIGQRGPWQWASPITKRHRNSKWVHITWQNFVENLVMEQRRGD